MKTLQLPILLAVALLLVACGEQPSNGDIAAAVTRSLEQKVPVKLARHLTGGQNATVSKVEILQIGEPQGKDEQRFWPVMVHASGTCEKMFGGREDFSGQMEYFVSKDRYGNWQARPNGL